MNSSIRTISIPAALLVAVALISSPAVAQEQGDSDAHKGQMQQMHGQSEGGMQGLGGGMLGGVSETEKEALLKGAGLGAGMIAMMNGYPGPKHILEMGEELELTAAQRDDRHDLRQGQGGIREVRNRARREGRGTCRNVHVWLGGHG